jgi:hypothetical protein
VSSSAPETTASTAGGRPRGSFGFGWTPGGDTVLIYPRRARDDSNAVDTGNAPSGKSGIIYTDRKDMPSLEELLQENKLAYAVLGERIVRPTLRSYLGAVTGGAIAAAVVTTGVLLFVDAVADNAIRANPYTALSLALGGLILLATLLVALRDSPAQREPTSDES